MDHWHRIRRTQGHLRIFVDADIETGELPRRFDASASTGQASR